MADLLFESGAEWLYWFQKCVDNIIPINKNTTTAFTNDKAVFKIANETIEIRRRVANSFHSLSLKSENFIEPFIICKRIFWQ